MGNIHELREADAARRYIAQGLLLARIRPITEANRGFVLDAILELVASGQPLPPAGFIADLALLLQAQGRDLRPSRELPALPALPDGLIRGYEDFVLGKLFADWSFERACDAVRRYEGRDFRRGLAFVVEQIRERAGFGGVMLSPAVVKTMIDAAPEEILVRARESVSRSGWQEPIVPLLENLLTGFRRLSEVLGPEDVFELEHRTALAELGQRIALRQTLQAMARFESMLPIHRPKPLPGRNEVPTHIFDEDAYPVGGYSSLSNRGSIESILHSQLAYMEPAKAERPDLFDIKFLRDELLFYSRDENQFLRRRRTLAIVLLPNLVEARFKDPELPNQRGILAIAYLATAANRLIRWLSNDALKIEFITVGGKLDQETDLLNVIFREQIANGTVEVTDVPSLSDAARMVESQSRRSLCHSLVVGISAQPLDFDRAVNGSLAVQVRPSLTLGNATLPESSAEPFDSWAESLQTLLQAWI